MFGYVIVGAGSAGCVLASRLSEDAEVKVCLLEAGPVDSHPLIHMPAGILWMMHCEVLNWHFYTRRPVEYLWQVSNARQAKVWAVCESISPSR